MPSPQPPARWVRRALVSERPSLAEVEGEGDRSMRMAVLRVVLRLVAAVSLVVRMVVQRPRGVRLVGRAVEER